jgi:hypothetical protein
MSGGNQARITLGVVASQAHPERGLAAAAERHPMVSTRQVGPDERVPVDVAGVVIDVPLLLRSRVLERMAGRSSVPVLVEAPVTTRIARARTLAEHARDIPVFSMNPLRHWLPTRRFQEQIRDAADPVETIFAAWRFRRGSDWSHALPQLVDYLGGIVGKPVARHTVVSRTNPTLHLITLRYTNDVVASLEIGHHLPETAAAPEELLIECFCRENVFHCEAWGQSLTVEGSSRGVHDWSPDPADQMLSSFLSAIRDGHPMVRSLADDLDALDLCDQVLAASLDRKAQSERDT